MKYKGAIFDLDGTLIDSMDSWENVGKIFLESQGIKPPSDLNEIIKEMSLKQSARYFKESLGAKGPIEAIIESIYKIVENKYASTIELKPYVKKTLHRFKLEGMKMCVATETDKILAEKALKRLGVLDYFDFIITSGEVSVGKYRPDIYIKAVKRLGFSIRETIVFEDALYAIKTAKKEGFDLVGIYDKSSQGQVDEMKEWSNYFIYSFKEMEGLF